MKSGVVTGAGSLVEGFHITETKFLAAAALTDTLDSKKEQEKILQSTDLHFAFFLCIRYTLYRSNPRDDSKHSMCAFFNHSFS